MVAAAGVVSKKNLPKNEISLPARKMTARYAVRSVGGGILGPKYVLREGEIISKHHGKIRRDVRQGEFI